MSQHYDFSIRVAEDDTESDVIAKIFYSLFVRRVKGHKPCVVYVGGDSGEGKSWSVLTIQMILAELQGFDFLENIKKTNVVNPSDYAKRLDALLFDKDLKKINYLAVHEARTIINAKQWQSFISQTVGDVNAMSRSLKRIIYFIVSQFIRDITTDTRYTLNYYLTVTRPIGRKARVKIQTVWKSDADIEKPKIRKRLVRGYLYFPDGTHIYYKPEYFELTKPPKAAIEIFDKMDYESKTIIIRQRLEKLIATFDQDINKGNKKVAAMVNWYMKNPEQLNELGKRRRGKWTMSGDAKQMHDLTDIEAKQFQDKIREKMKEGGMI